MLNLFYPAHRFIYKTVFNIQTNGTEKSQLAAWKSVMKRGPVVQNIEALKGDYMIYSSCMH